MEQPTPAAAGQPAPDSAAPALITISLAQLRLALLHWETASRPGQTLPPGEAGALPPEQCADASAAYLWPLLASAGDQRIKTCLERSFDDWIARKLAPQEAQTVGIDYAANAHPSRSTKRCIDCQHFSEFRTHAHCRHPAAPVDPVTGAPDLLCRHARRDGDHDRGPGICGPAAALFEPLPEAAA